MSKLKLGVQLFTMRKETKNPKNMGSVFEFIKGTGAEVVELSAMPKVDASEIKRLADINGLSICATHSPYARIKNDIERLCEEHLVYQCPTIGIASMPMGYGRDTLDGWKRFSDFMNEKSAEIKKYGLSLRYHNHAFEFKKIGGVRKLDILMKLLSPEVNFCLDIFWAKVGGVEPLEYIDKMGSRLTDIHMKGYRKRLFGEKIVPVGQGTLPYLEYLKQCEKHQIAHALVEIDTAKDPRVAIKASMDYLITNYL